MTPEDRPAREAFAAVPYFNWKRAPAVGYGRVHFMLICATLLNNINSALAYAERCRKREAA